METRQSDLNKTGLKIFLACLIIASVILAFSSVGCNSAVSPVQQLLQDRPTKPSVGGEDNDIPNSPHITNIATVSKETYTASSFTLSRSSYDPLPFFGSDTSTLLQYSHLSDYTAIVEPHITMKFAIVDDDYPDDNYYKFSLCENPDDEESCVEGKYFPDDQDSSTGVKTKCTPLTSYTFNIEVYGSDDELISTLSSKALCMYVRREIRSLSTKDLKKTMDAMFTLWNTSEVEGQALYGSDFHSSTYFVEAHHFNAAWQDGDHIHEGMGFLPQHIKMTNMFELAMQAVDASISLPYWDFTIESEAGKVVQDSPIFTEEMFGTITPALNTRLGWSYSNDNITSAAIPNGRWAYIKADLSPSKFEGTLLDAAYGYLRAPWNMNPSPYVSRFSSYSSALPGCSDYVRWTKNTDLTNFMKDAPYGPHAGTHGILGSVFGCDLLDPLREAGLIDEVTDQLALCGKWGFYMKEMYRQNFLTARDDCEMPESDASPLLTLEGMDCGFTCNPKTIALMSKELSKVISSKYLPDGGLSDDQWDVMKDFVCTGDGYKIFVGDHLESASPSDPSFWPIHPSMERLLQAKLMAGGFETYEWSSDIATGYVCDKSECYEYEEGSKGEFDACCYGHYENDQLLDFVSANKSQGVGMTNAQVMSYTDPTGQLSFTEPASGETLSGYAMPYIYDNFEWNHCEDDDFDVLFAMLASTTSSSSSPQSRDEDKRGGG